MGHCAAGQAAHTEKAQPRVGDPQEAALEAGSREGGGSRQDALQLLVLRVFLIPRDF